MNTEQLTITDPICKMQLRPEQIKESVVVDGVRYSFCSIGCRAEFERHPEDYIQRARKEGQHV